MRTIQSNSNKVHLFPIGYVMSVLIGALLKKVDGGPVTIFKLLRRRTKN